jgi:hypothetical protein
MALRSLPDAVFEQEQNSFHHRGPFLPVILEACEENQLSYEYRHGVTSYGAFTYSMTRILRETLRQSKAMSWEELITATAGKLERLKYDQTPVLVGPKNVIAEQIPWPALTTSRTPPGSK